MKTASGVVVVVVSLVALLFCCCLPAAARSVASAAGTTAKSSNDNDLCRYIISVKTGNRKDAGTDAKISARFTNAGQRQRLLIENLAAHSWPDFHVDPFERGSLDTFEVWDSCILDLCFLQLISDGSGNKPGWYVEYVRIEGDYTYIVPHQFEFYRWLEPPYRLYAAKDLCGAAVGGVATM